MNLRLGFYEVFSRIVPGGLYVVAVVQFLSIFGMINFDWKVINDLSLAALIGLIIVAYILGGAFDIFSLALFRLFKKKGFSRRSLAQFKADYADRWQIDFKDNDHLILLAYIRTKNIDLAGELDRDNAVYIMLRNISLGLLLMALNSLIQFFILRNLVSLLMALSMLVLSILMMRESIKYRAYFFNGIYQTILAYRIDLETAIRPVRPGRRRSSKVERKE